MMVACTCTWPGRMEKNRCESHSGVIFCLFPSWRWRWVLKILVSVALCGSCRSVRHTPNQGTHPAPLQRNLSSRMFWHQQTKGISFRIALFSSDLGLRTCYPALSSQDTIIVVWLNRRALRSFCGDTIRKGNARRGIPVCCKCVSA